MRYRWFVGGLLLALPIAGCHGDFFDVRSSVYGDAPADSLRGQCERAAYNDPQVKDAVAAQAVRAGYQGGGIADLAAVRRAAVQRCMMQRGGTTTGGGVELPHS
jgi:hypothetical protein